MSGELILAIAYGSVLVLAGLWIASRVSQDYRDPNDDDER